MSHVQIGSNADGSYRLVVDGVDISKAVIADTVRVGFETTTVGGRIAPTVHLGLFASTLDIDLPEAVLEAGRDPGDFTAVLSEEARR